MSTVASIVFWAAGATAVLSAVGVVAANSPVYSALSLIVTLAQLAVMYILLNAQFLAAAQILIYAGAVMVLFLFVITLLGVESVPFLGQHLPFQRPISMILGALLLFGVIFFIAQSPNWLTGGQGTFNQQLAHGNVEAFGTQLFTTFFFPFELTAPLLIVAMVGAVALGKRRHEDPPR